ncbi:MAG: 50S ribosome-binding GTPase [Anaerolineae bacterium]|jgi:GTP-binding protein Era
MSDVEEVLPEVPEPARQPAGELWDALPPALRSELDTLLPAGGGALKEVLGLILDQYQPVWGEKRRIAVVGPANAGKSTLYNQLIARDADRAEVSPVPGTTRARQESDAGLFVIIDTPGADAVGAVGEREREIAFRAAAGADFLVVLFDAAQGIRQAERDLFDDLVVLARPYVVVLNKMDLIDKRDREAVVEAAAHNLGLAPFQLIQTVATEGENVERVVLDIVRIEPALAAILAEVLPQYQAKIAWQRVAAAAGAAGVIGLTPLPLADVIPLLTIQVGLVLSLARIYGLRITAGRARELIGAFGAGLLGRAAFRQLAKLGGVPGWVLAAAVAAATTAALGYGTMLWFAHGEKPTRETLQRVTDRIAQRLRARLLRLGEARPEKQSLRARIAEAVADLRGELEEDAAAPDLAAAGDEQGA